MTPGQIYDVASTVLAQKLSQVDGVGEVTRRRQLAAGGARRAQPAALNQYGIGARGRARRARHGQREPPEGRRSRTATGTGRSTPTTRRDRRRVPAAGRRLPQRRRRCGSATSREVVDSVQDMRNAGSANGRPAVLVVINRAAGRQHHRDGRPRARAAAAAARLDAGGDRSRRRDGAHVDHPRLAARGRADAADRGRAGRPGGVRCSCAAARATLIPARGGAGVARSAPSASCTSAATASTTCR